MGIVIRDKVVFYLMLGVVGIIWTRIVVLAFVVAVDSKMAVIGVIIIVGIIVLIITSGVSIYRKLLRRIGSFYCQLIKGWRSEYIEQRIGEGGFYRGFFIQRIGEGVFIGVFYLVNFLLRKRGKLFLEEDYLFYLKKEEGVFQGIMMFFMLCYNGMQIN